MRETCKTCQRPHDQWPMAHRNTDFCSRLCQEIDAGEQPRTALEDLNRWIQR